MVSNDQTPATTPISRLSGIGQAYAAKLARLNITSVRDLCHHYPARFLDYRRQRPIREIKVKTEVSFQAVLGEPQRFTTRSGKSVTTVVARDPSGKINLTWFNNPYIGRLIKPGERYLVAGKTSFFADKVTLVAPTIEPVKSQSLHTQGLVPIYPLTAGVSSRFLRQKVQSALDRSAIPDGLADQVLAKYGLVGYSAGLRSIHFPKDPADHLAADKRLSFNHHLWLNLTNLSAIKKLPPAAALTTNLNLHRRLAASLPFKLTPGQIKAIENGYRDLGQTTFSHRLIQGETGSGKTVIVFFLAAQALAGRHSLCLLVPSEILAFQHYQTFKKFGLSEKQLCLVSAANPLAGLPSAPAVFIGTHALLTQLPSTLAFPLAAIVIDEQHKFGVKQRDRLLARRPTPHLFNLSATPIPRTLALGLFGEVAISSLKTKPQKRLPVKTWVMDHNRFQKSSPWLKKQISRGSKVFAVAPTIRGSADRAGAEKIYQHYQSECGSFTPVYLLHGQLKPAVIEKTLADFRKARGGILVATTIIEVGIDIPEADIIIIHDADNFGLATLHQLRGRVGRRERQGFCFLIGSADNQEGFDRLKLLEKHHSGLTLAKMDLRLRGAGELFGEKQHGWLPVRLKNFWDKSLFRQAKGFARQLLEEDASRALAIASSLASW